MENELSINRYHVTLDNQSLMAGDSNRILLESLNVVVSYGFIADIHSNHVALKVAIEILQNLGVDGMFCAGDVVGYGCGPNEAIGLLKKYKIRSILGNHDFFLMEEAYLKGLTTNWPNIPEFRAIGENRIHFSPVGMETLDWNLVMVSKANLKWLGSLPILGTVNNSEVSMIHGSPSLSSRTPPVKIEDYFYSLVNYLHPWNKDTIALHSKLVPSPTLVVGHTHMQHAQQTFHGTAANASLIYPCLMNFDDFPVSKVFQGPSPLIVNPGSAGLSRDNIQAPGICTISFTGKKRKKVTWLRFTYDFDEYQDLLIKRGAPRKVLEIDFWRIDSELKGLHYSVIQKEAV
ncbi:MAG: metallophosphoesterase family protein [Candidatus Odinarchaeota archaeon]